MKNQNTQTRTPLSIHRKVKYLRDRRHWKWRDICIHVGILKKSGEPDTGLAYDFYQDETYVPSDSDVQKRLGLRPRCGTCKRRLPDGRNTDTQHTDTDKTERHPAVKWWDSLTPAQRFACKYYLFENKGELPL